MENLDIATLQELSNLLVARTKNAYKYCKYGCSEIVEYIGIGGISIFGLFIGLFYGISYISQFISNFSLEIWIWAMDKLGRKRIILDRDQTEPYLERYYLLFRERNKNYPFNIFIHKIIKSDTDMHDHPWGYRTLILSGGYWEHEFTTHLGTDTSKTWRGPGYTYVYDACHSHKITLEEGIACWTIFMPFKQEKPWGFWKIIQKETNKPTTRGEVARMLLNLSSEKQEAVEYQKIWVKHNIFLKKNVDISNKTDSDEELHDKIEEDFVDYDKNKVEDETDKKYN